MFHISNWYKSLVVMDDFLIFAISALVKSIKKTVSTSAKSKDIFASFSGDWGGDMTTEDYADMLRSENVESKM